MKESKTRYIKPVSDQQKMTIQLFLGVVMAVIGMVLLWVSLFIPPMGVIDASVLTAFGEVATFAGALIGIDYTYKYKSIQYLSERDWRERESRKPRRHLYGTGTDDDEDTGDEDTED